jgi:pyruvate carboxylase
VVVAGLVLEEIITLMEDRGAGTLAHEPLQELAVRSSPRAWSIARVDVAHSWLHAAPWLRLRHARRLRTLRGGQAPS